MLESVKSLTSIKSYRLRVESEEITLEGEFIFGMVTNTISVGGFKGCLLYTSQAGGVYGTQTGFDKGIRYRFRGRGRQGSLPDWEMCIRDSVYPAHDIY